METSQAVRRGGPSVTVHVAVDSKTLTQLILSHRTWLRHHPELFTLPWLVTYDREQLSLIELSTALHRMGLRDVSLAAWPFDDTQYDSQRERMLSAHVFSPARHVGTEWWMKIDTDAVCMKPGFPLADLDWFEPTSDNRHNAWIASSWHYTVGSDFIQRLDDWADTVDELRDKPRLNLPYTLGARTISHPRMCSWMSYYNTSWSRRVASYASRSLGRYRLPVPSQDTFHWFVATREQWPSLAIRKLFKRRGWTNCPSQDKLVQHIQESLYV